MSSAGTRERTLQESRKQGLSIKGSAWEKAGGVVSPLPPDVLTAVGKQVTVSESHPRDHDGSYREGGPFYTSLVRDFLKTGYIENAYKAPLGQYYTGPVSGQFPTLQEKKELGYKNINGLFGDKNESQMAKDGTTAISLCAPTNPASNLGTTLAETFREGVPTLPGIQLWRDKTKFLKGLGSEYLNYQFGWAPLRDEVTSVRDAARNHADIMKSYHRGEGSDTHRTFNFPSQHSSSSLPETQPGSWLGPPWEWSGQGGFRKVSMVSETKRWFEGVFTYALPSSTTAGERR
jgi:hypothetical protein